MTIQAQARLPLLVNPIDPIVAVLTAERIRRGFSQSEVERRIPCAGGLVSRTERGFNAPTLPILRRWAAVLEMNISVFYREGVPVVATPDGTHEAIESG